MILAVDIGNTNINIGAFKGKKLITHFCVNNKLLVNKKSIFPLERSILNESIYIIVASVNPRMNSVFYKYLGEKHNKKVLIIGREIIPKIPILVKNPEKVGIDRLLNTLAAYRRTKSSTMVVDFGTAITIDVVSNDGEFMGGLILPGMRTSAYALNNKTALLPEVDIRRPANIIGNSVENAIKAGVYFGIVGAIIHIIKEVKMVYENLQHTVATGGDAKIFKKDIPAIDKLVPHLTLDGIRIAFEENLH